MGTIHDYLPKREPTTSIQVKMPKALVERVKRQMRDDKVNNWSDFLTACFLSYLNNKKTGTNNNTVNSQLKHVQAEIVSKDLLWATETDWVRSSDH